MVLSGHYPTRVGLGAIKYKLATLYWKSFYKWKTYKTKMQKKKDNAIPIRSKSGVYIDRCNILCAVSESRIALFMR